MDITEIILEQHAQQRAAFAQLEEFPKKDVEGLEALWKRLVIFLETHAEAEERYFYPHLLEKGTGAADADDGTVEGEVEDAIKDHNKIRDAIGRADEAKVGSDEWWQAVTDADIANSEHMGEEERQDLRDFRDHPMEVPKLTKIVINMGVGEAAGDQKKLDAAVPQAEAREDVMLKEAEGKAEPAKKASAKKASPKK